ncbi:MAG: Stp1/IreP family PP2C-type Ser/Thr phosphatase [Lachnospiraceae bacterium]|nr:Stp1/IreP family PP2C-type Ser/Thr phosphatase [Robinsoniella sp.]MDY3767213.1 Stp1/IreP family PP2C-type Ser/Thr phosphatase [Lachnospiraceae bacterium]
MKSYCITDVGQRRTMNQDFVFRSDEPVGNLPNLFVVADGMGGHKAGDYASHYTVETLVESIREDQEKNPIKIIRKAIEKANEKVLEKSLSDEGLAGMGTTIVVATVIGHYLYVANVGDSRLYLVTDKITQITKDHSLVEEMVRIGEINREQARNHPDRNIITRAVGVKKEVKIDFFDMRLHRGDLILMCSDGLSNMLEDSEIEEIIKKGGELSEIAKELVRRANQNGGKDNIAVVLAEPLTDEVGEC